MEVLVGSKVSYDPLNKIGQGGFGSVFNGIYEGTKSVAVKKLQKSEVSSSNVIFEADILRDVNDHPNILRYYCTEEDEHFIYIVTELCAGTLRDLVTGIYQGLPVGDEREILHQITLGLQYLHVDKGIVHRDIKPDNILISKPDGITVKPRMKLADFGVCRALKPGRMDFTNTNPESPLGSPGWIAPELYESGTYDFPVDIFALGCVFGYTLSGGKHPFGNGLNGLIRIVNKEPMIITIEDIVRGPSPAQVSFQLIQSMTELHVLSSRPTVQEVLSHPFFGNLKIEAEFPIMRQIEERPTDYHQVSIAPVDCHSFDFKSDENSTTERLLELCKLCDANLSIAGSFIQLLETVNRKESVSSIMDEEGRTLLILLCGNTKITCLYECVEALLKAVPNAEDYVNMEDESQDSAIDVLCYYNHNRADLCDILSLLINCEVDLNHRNAHGWTALHQLCCYYKGTHLQAILRLFITAGANVDCKIPMGDKWTPLLMLCCHYVHDDLMELIKTLLNDGKVSARRAITSDGWTPLHLLMLSFSNENLHNNLPLVDIVRFLIEQGVPIHAETDEGWTALDIFRSASPNKVDENQRKELVRLLKRSRDAGHIPSLVRIIPSCVLIIFVAFKIVKSLRG